YTAAPSTAPPAGPRPATAAPSTAPPAAPRATPHTAASSNGPERLRLGPLAAMNANYRGVEPAGGADAGDCRRPLHLGQHDDGRDRRQDHPTDGEQGDRRRGEGRGFTPVDRALERAMAARSDDEQGDREQRVAAPEH